MSAQGLQLTALRFGGPGGRLLTARPGVVTAVRRRAWAPATAIDVLAVSLAVLDVSLVTPSGAPGYSSALSWLACAALLGRRWFPFLTVLATFPGFMAGWSQLAAMLALGFLAHRKGLHWQVWVGAGLVVACRFVMWPPEEMLGFSWGEHVKNLLYAPIVAGMPIAIGLLVLARKDLSRRLAQLDASRDRERQMHARAARADERARIAREMHDVVSHDVTLIAMQANALEVANDPADVRTSADSIRELSNRTLEELRSLVGVLRSGDGTDLPAPGVHHVGELARSTDVAVHMKVENLPDVLPPAVSAAAYRTVQEALTNVHKHAPGATATVSVGCSDTRLHVAIVNGPATRPAETRELPSGGHGLSGLAERATMLDGTFDAGVTDDGGFAVRVDLPVTTSVAEDAAPPVPEPAG